MPRKRIENRVGAVADLGVGVLDKYKIKFNKQSTDGSGKTNIVPDGDSQVIGVVYELSKGQLDILDRIEIGYERGNLPLEVNGELVCVEVYVALPETINNELLPTRKYLEYLIQGAKEHDFPSDYVEFLEEVNSRG